MTNNMQTQWARRLSGELQNAAGGLFVYDRNTAIASDSDSSVLLIDFSDASCGNAMELHAVMSAALKKGRTLVLLHVGDAELLSAILGFGVSGQCVIIRPYEGFLAVNVFEPEWDAEVTCGESTVTQSDDGNRCVHVDATDEVCCPPAEPSPAFEDLCVSEQARVIANILAEDFKAPREFSCAASLQNTPAALPPHQYRLIYLTIERSWNLTDRQVANNSVIMEVSLIASYNPAYKYLRIRSLGAGFSPANGAPMESDTKYDRGYFQSGINIHMQPQSEQLKVLSTEPKNINGSTQYSAGSEFSVGVDIKKNPSFSSSYSISECTTTEISDFSVYNNGAGITADWDFLLSMTENSIWDIFSQPFLRKGQVKELPALATRNLQPVTEAVWFGPSTLNDNVGIRLYWIATLDRCWVTGDWTKYHMKNSNIQMKFGFLNDPFQINFSSVYA